MKMPKWVGSLVCLWAEHLRGRRLLVTEVTFSEPGVGQFECPRCGAQWTRRVYPRKPKEPSA